MLRSRLFLAGIAATAFSALLAGCGSSTTPSGSTTNGAGGGGQTGAGGGGQGATVGLPPARPDGAKPGDGSDVVFAIDKLLLGDANRDGTPNSQNGWKQYGFNLDGKVSTKDSKDLCKPAGGAAPSQVYPDGIDGIDNSFGKNILPIILGLSSGAGTKVNDSINQGKFTVMLDLAKLGTGDTYNPLSAKLYAGGDLGAAPKWDGTDAWPVRPELLSNPADVTSSKVSFPNGYLTKNTWVSGDKGDLTLSLSISGFTLDLTIGSALIAVDLDAAHKTGANGTIAGIIETEVLISEIKKVAGAFDKTLCTGSTIDGIANQLRQASDILKDGSQDPTKTCDGISIGLGFSAKVVKLGPVAPPAAVKPNPCDATGAGGAGG
jgi:hypothetical protein